MNFIEEVMELYKDAETPPQFFQWSALAALSAAARRDVWLNRKGVFLTYPNIYVMLVARSGMKKGLPVKVIKKIVELAEVTKIIGGRNSIEAIIDNLSKQYTTESGVVFTEAQAFIVNDELNSLLLHNLAAQTILTTIHDSFYHDNWSYTLKGEGTSVLKNICVTMLTATNKSHLEEFLDPASVKGGFIGRTFLIPAEKRNKGNLLISDQPDDDLPQVDHTAHIHWLKDIAQLKGPFKISTPAKNFLEEWYAELLIQLDKMSDDPDETGTIERLDTNALKLAMLLSLSESLTLEINLDHAKRGVELAEWASSCVNSVISVTGKSEDSGKVRSVLDYLITQDGFRALRSKILRAKYKDISAPDLTNIANTLEQAGILRTENKPDGVWYILQERYAEKFKVAMQKEKSVSKVVSL